jgi:hypothetical protein
MPEYRVRQGDCIESIAFDHGLLWDTIWFDARNRGLRSARREHSLLKPGDKVHVPDLRPRHESGCTEQRHRFRRNGVPSKLQLRLLFNGEPRGNIEYSLDIDGRLCSGVTDADGCLEHSISPSARQASLILTEGNEAEEYEIDLGYLDPDSELTGIQGRLANLGFACASTGLPDEETEKALRAFQRLYGLRVTGQLDQRTRKKIVDIHDSKLGEPPPECATDGAEDGHSDYENRSQPRKEEPAIA